MAWPNNIRSDRPRNTISLDECRAEFVLPFSPALRLRPSLNYLPPAKIVLDAPSSVIRGRRMISSAYCLPTYSTLDTYCGEAACDLQALTT